MTDFTKRLRWCIKHGDMTVADLHHWFERPRSTVRTWVLHARIPGGPAAAKACLLLDLLEGRIKKRRGFPIPADLSWFDRPDYVKKLRHDTAGARLSTPHSTG